jgi:hypothetical protein
MITWPDMKFPPINLWSAPVQKTSKNTVVGINKERCKEYMELLKWLEDNPMPPIVVSNLVLNKKER